VRGWWFSSSVAVSSTNKTDSHNTTEVFLKVALNTTPTLMTGKMIGYNFERRQPKNAPDTHCLNWYSGLIQRRRLLNKFTMQDGQTTEIK
jgi:hypothetical protein